MVVPRGPMLLNLSQLLLAMRKLTHGAIQTEAALPVRAELGFKQRMRGTQLLRVHPRKNGEIQRV